MREVLARIASKNHYNGARNPRAQFQPGGLASRRSATRRSMAGELRVYDCSGVADGSAAAIVVRAEDAHKYTDKPIYIKALSFVAGNCSGQRRPRLRLHDVPRDRGDRPPTPTRRPASPTRAQQIAMAEVHDCFTPAELLIMEDLGFAERGTAWKEVLDGHVRPRRRHPGQPRRRPEELRPPGRRVGAADDVRGVAPAARARRPRSAQIDTPTAARAHPQPRRLPRRDGVLFVSILGRERSADDPALRRARLKKAVHAHAAARMHAHAVARCMHAVARVHAHDGSAGACIEAFHGVAPARYRSPPCRLGLQPRNRDAPMSRSLRDSLHSAVVPPRDVRSTGTPSADPSAARRGDPARFRIVPKARRPTNLT